MSVVECLIEMGGVALRRDLVLRTSRAAVDAAIQAGDVVVVARGRYALPAAEQSLIHAHRLSGVVSHLSAALLWGWEVTIAPDLAHVTVARHRTLTAEQRRGVHLHWARLGPDDVRGRVTSPDRTLLDCLRQPDFPTALSVADSALRHGLTPSRLSLIARDARGPGSARVRKVAQEASALAANPFESALRGIASDVPGLNVRPQVPVFSGTHSLGRPDLVDDELGIIVEADSFEWHGGRAALRRDCRRYDSFVAAGWLVLRFAWEDVMFDACWVREILVAVVHQRAEGSWRFTRPA